MASIVNTTLQGLSIPIGAAGGTPLNTSIFGDGRDGKVTIATGETRTIEIVEDCQIAELNCVSLDIEAGAKLTTSGRCPALIIKVQNDCTIHGTIDMDKKAPLQSTNETEFAMHPVIVLCGSQVGGNGGRGGQSISYSSGQGSGTKAGGAGGLGHRFGGGYGGGGGGTYREGGSAVERPPVGVTWPYPGSSSTDVSMYGAGGSGYYGAQGGAAPGGSGGCHSDYVNENEGDNTETPINGLAGEAYGGGVIYLIVGGNLTRGSGGILTANGGDGGKSVTGTIMRSYADSTGYHGNVYSGSGGGGGGGVICIVHRGTLINGGVLYVNGGLAGVGTQYTIWPTGAVSSQTLTSYGSNGSVGSTFIRSFDALTGKEG